MSSRTTTVRPTRTTTKANQDTSQQESQPPPAQDRCAHCKKFLPAVKAECRFCRLVFCMEHRHPETHSPTGCAQRARDQSRQQFQHDSGHILGAEANDRGITHRQPGWNLEQSRQDLHQRLNQRVQTLKESTGRASSSSASSASSSGSGSGSVKKKSKGAGKKTTNKPKTWGTGGSRLGGVPGSGTGGGGSEPSAAPTP
ncbi:hypothetical protein BGZ70_002654 [Mortierella alpina]|uniref:AN1-type domain-containing protein n=1 Tax=Mortierella alpina TaxID=64518 RepID=A0A9P6JBH8_MORAP|nr:hypothetical protein BGZ70_002654 [Mortierella alpina]